MAESRRSRGAHPKDAACFADEAIDRLRRASADLSWLLGRGYSARAALDLVGNRYALRDRQRQALQRVAAGQRQVAARRAREVGCRSLTGETVAVDGFNVLLTVESALSGGVLLLAQDGTMRDLASMTAHYRRVAQTKAALALIVDFLIAAEVAEVVVYLDRPVGNSGRLEALISQQFKKRGLGWRVRAVGNVDRTLAGSKHVVASADSTILDRCRRWCNLARAVVERSIPAAWVVDLRTDRSAQPSSSTTTAVP